MTFTELWDRITAFLRRLFGRQVEERDLTRMEPTQEKPPGKRWREFPFGVIKTSRGGISMPKYQRCPNCHGNCKRGNKTATGAKYECTSCHITFPVKASRGQLRQQRKRRKLQKAEE